MGKGLFNRLEGELEARQKALGLQMSDLLALPEPQCGLLNWMIRQQQVDFADVTTFLGQDEARARAILADLCGKGYVREIELRGVTQYRVRFAPKRGGALSSNLWAALDDKVDHAGEKGR